MVRKYRTPFLKQVIVRLDFSYPVLKLARTIPQGLREAISRSFPISEPKGFIGKELIVTKGITKEKTLEGTDWYFHSMDRQKTLIVCRDNVNISYAQYDTFDVLKQDFLPIVTELFDTYDDFEGKRLGLRYINEIALPENDLLDWSDYLDERLLTSLSFPQDPRRICRAFNNLELNHGDLIIRFQYGMFNPDYPAPIRKKSFVLDYDAHLQGPQNLDDVKHSVDVFHQAIQELFEYSISDGLRRLMGVDEDG